MNNYTLMRNYADSGDWDNAIKMAAKLRSQNGFQELSTHENQIPPSHIANFISAAQRYNPSELTGIAYYLSDNLHPELTNEHLHKVWKMSPKDHYVDNNVTTHPNFQQDSGKVGAGDFWNSYERSVKPEHFAAIKSMYSGEPESIATHRGEQGDSITHEDTIPHLFQHMQASQNAILNDPNIKKVNVKGEPHVEVYRGIGGSYAKTVKDGLGIQDHFFEKTLPGGMSPFRIGIRGQISKHKTVNVPSAHMSSWSLDQNMAERFATSRGEHDSLANPHHVVMKKLVPVSSILHSGMHNLFPGHSPVHENEQEVVVAHPEGKYKLSSKDVLVGHSGDDWGTYRFKAPEIVKEPKPITSDDIHRMIKLNPSKTFKAFQNHPAFNSGHMDALVQKDPWGAAVYGNAHPLLTVNHIDSIAERAPDKLRALKDNSLINESHIHKAIVPDPEKALDAFANHPAFNGSHMRKIHFKAPVAAEVYLMQHPEKQSLLTSPAPTNNSLTDVKKSVNSQKWNFLKNKVLKKD